MAMVLALIACNTENDGVFKRISESVEREVVGAVTLIMFDGNNDLIAHTKIEGIMTYDLSDKKWIPLIDQEDDLAVLDTKRRDIFDNMVASDVNENTLYFATSGSDTYNTSLFAYDSTTTPPYTASDLNDSYQIKAMSPQADLMVVYDDDSVKFNVYKPSVVMGGGPLSLIMYTAFAYEQINLLAIDVDTFLITGYDAEKATYNHVFYDDDSIKVTNLGDLSPNSMIVAMHKSNSVYIFIANNGKIYYGADLENLTEATSTLPLPDTNMAFRTLPVLSDGTDVYVQGANKRIYQIATTDGSYTDASSQFSSTITNVEIHSFLSDSDGTNHYVGTKGHGIMEMVFP